MTTIALAACRLCADETDTALCGRCVRRLGRALGDMPGLVADLERTVARQTAGARIVRAGGDRTPLPFADGPRIDDARQAVDGLAEWAELIAGDDARSTLRDLPHRAFVAAAAILSRLEWFRENERAGDAASRLLKIRAALRRAVDRPPSRVYAGPCGAEVETIVLDVDPSGAVLTPRLESTVCGGDVIAEPGDPLAHCGGCGGHHHVTDRRAAILASLEYELTPLAEILDALPVLIGRSPDPATVRKWRSRGRLAPVSVDVHGRPLYRAGEVIRLAQDKTPRPGPRRQDAKGIPA